MKQSITKSTLIGDILSQNPEKAHELSEVMTNFGIHCVSCGVASFEPLEQGVLSHGYSEEDLNKLITDLNKVINQKETKPETKPTNFSLKLTPKALTKIKQTIKSEGEGKILRVSVIIGGCLGQTYDLEIIETAPKEDLKFKQEDLEISVDKNSLEYLNNTEIDFIESQEESGFKFNNPNENN
jgi:iron-sulfur cluster assembly accessory protein